MTGGDPATYTLDAARVLQGRLVEPPRPARSPASSCPPGFVLRLSPESPREGAPRCTFPSSIHRPLLAPDGADESDSALPRELGPYLSRFNSSMSRRSCWICSRRSSI